MEIQRLPLLNLNSNKQVNRAKPTKAERAPKETASSKTDKAESSQQSAGEVLISVSNTVANSNGIDLSGSHLSFAVDDDTGSTVINIVDSSSGEVLKQIPPEDLLKLRKRMGEIQGLLLDRKA